MDLEQLLRQEHFMAIDPHFVNVACKLNGLQAIDQTLPKWPAINNHC